MWVAAAQAATWTVAAGGQLETAAHGILDAELRGERASVALQTDTLDARLWRTGQRGRLEVGGRAAAFAAGMWITPWRDGAPDVSRAHRVAYVGPDVRAQAFLGRGWYVEGSGWVQRHVFTPMATQVGPPLADRWWTHGEATLGGWFAGGVTQLRVAAGVDRTDGGGAVVAPYVAVATSWRPTEPRWAPGFAVVARAAQGADAVLATRVGGMTPYAVPLAGAAWAELWVEDVAAARGELRARVVDREARLWLHGALDAVAWWATDDPLAPAGDGVALGVEAGGRWERRGAFAVLAVGHAPGLARQPGVWPAPVFVRVGATGGGR